MGGLKGIDLAMVVAYLVGLFLLGAYFSRQQDSEQSYFLGDRNVPWYLAGISVLATLLSTLSYISVPGEMIRHGVGFFASLLVFVVVIPVVNRVIIPSLMQLRVTSVYEFLEHRFDSSVRDVGAYVFIVTRFIWMGLVIYTTSFALSAMTGWSVPTLVLIIGLVTTFYTSAGGFRAVLWSDFAQFVVMVGGVIVTIGYIAATTATGPGTWWGVFSEAGRSSVPVFSVDPTTRVSLLGVMISTFVWNICTHGADQIAAQRYLSTPSVQAARRSVWAFAVSNVGMIALLMLCGLALFYFYFLQASLPVQQFQAQIAAKADSIFPRFIVDVLPPGIAGLLLAALLSAAMSSLSSGINSISSVVVTNILRQPARHGRVVRRAVIVSVLSGIVGMLVALIVYSFMRRSDWNILELMERVNHLFVAPLGALFFVGMFLKRADARCVLLGFCAGLLVSVLIAFSKELFGMREPISFMWIMPVSFVVSFVVAHIASWVMPARTARAPI